MAIKNGEAGSADEVMNALGSLFNDTAQNLFNAAYIGFDSALGGDGEPNLKNVEYATGLVGTYYSYGISTYDFSGNTFADSWIGSGQSTGATGGYVYANVANATASSYAVSNGTTPIIIEDGGSYIMDSYMSSNYASSSAGIQIFDGTTGVNIRSQSSSTTSARSVQRLNVNKTNETAYLTTDIDSLTDTGIDLSSLNNAATWYVRIFSSHGDSGSPTSTTCQLWRFDTLSDSTSNDYIIDVGTASATVTNLIPIINDYSSGTVSAIYSVSVDNGANYEVVTSATVLRPTNTGTQIKLKAELTSDSSYNMTYLTEYAIKYNLY